MTIEANIVCDSITGGGARLTTFIVKFPRFILPELLTHREFSRSTSSSRAIPISKLIDSAREDLARPLSFRANAKGMQPSGDIPQQLDAHQIWEHAAMKMCEYAGELSELGVAKEIANRLLEPFTHTSMIITSTGFSNFFALRCHPLAQAEIRLLAVKMSEAYYSTTPVAALNGTWHLPLIRESEKVGGWGRDLVKASVARCARVSYLNHDGTEPDMEKDLALYERLVTADPGHMSPLEHQAFPGDPLNKYGNFKGWVQLRGLVEGGAFV